MQQRSGRHYLQAKQEYFDTGKIGKVTLVRTWWHGNTYHLRTAPASLKTQPADLDWAKFLGPVKWRDWDGQQYYNWRAYLDYGGGQITDLFTHWIDVVHMFMGQDIPIAASASGGVYHYKDGRTAPDTINVLLEYPTNFTATFEATLVPGIGGAAIEFCGSQGRLMISRARYEYFEVPRSGTGRISPTPTATVQASGDLDRRSHAELPGLREVAEAAERRRAHRAPLGAGVAPGQPRVSREAPDQFRSGPRTGLLTMPTPMRSQPCRGGRVHCWRRSRSSSPPRGLLSTAQNPPPALSPPAQTAKPDPNLGFTDTPMLPNLAVARARSGAAAPEVVTPGDGAGRAAVRRDRARSTARICRSGDTGVQGQPPAPLVDAKWVVRDGYFEVPTPRARATCSRGKLRRRPDPPRVGGTGGRRAARARGAATAG